MTNQNISNGIIKIEKMYEKKYSDMLKIMIYKKLKGCTEKKVEIIFNDIIDSFVPTSIVRLPLLPHYIKAINAPFKQWENTNVDPKNFKTNAEPILWTSKKCCTTENKD